MSDNIFTSIKSSPIFTLEDKQFHNLGNGCYAVSDGNSSGIPSKLFFGIAEKYDFEDFSLNFTDNIIPFTIVTEGNSIAVKPVLENISFSQNQSSTLPSHAIKTEINLPSIIRLSYSKTEEPLVLMFLGNEIVIDASYGSITVKNQPSMPAIPTDQALDITLITDGKLLAILCGEGKTFGLYDIESKNKLLTLGGEGALDSISIDTF